MSLRLGAGGTGSFSIAGLRLLIESRLPAPLELEIPAPYRPFSTESTPCDLRIVLQGSAKGGRAPGAIVFDSGLNWRVRSRDGELPHFESYHPPSARRVAVAMPQVTFHHFIVSFEEETCRWLAPASMEAPLKLDLPYPLGQLLFLPILAERGGFLVHASAAVIGEHAYLFAGHSGDGKTTLTRLLADEGIESLSDERVAVRREGSGFYAYGTPWPGEGDVASPGRFPLAGIFLLRKATGHRVEEPRRGCVADLLARSIVPYYLADHAEQILRLIHAVTETVPLRDLAFCRAPGLGAVLSDFADRHRETNRSRRAS